MLGGAAVIAVMMIVTATMMMGAMIVVMVVQSEFQFVFPCVKSFSSSESDDKIAVVFGSMIFL